MPDIDKSYQELIITNFGLSPSGYTGSIGAVGATGPAGGYTGSRGDAGYVGSAGPGMSMTTDTFTGDGATTAFVLTTTPDSINRTIVNYNGVTVLRSAYTLSSATITFSSAPAAGSQIEITTINSASGSGGATGTALKITTVGYVGNNTATDTAGGETVTLTGTGFVTGASVIINGVAAGVVTVASATQLTFTAPAMAAGTYIFYVVNTDGATAISVPGISYSGVPSFYVGAGSVGSVYEASSFNSNVAAVGDSAITYSIASGSLPAGATLNANGIITGSSVLTASPTTYTFGVTASDGQNQDVTRSYTITVNPDAVTWSTPANGATVILGQNSSTSTTLTAVSAAGKTITYTANALPSGLSIVGGAVTGTPTVTGNTTTLLTATAADTTRTADITVVWNVAVTNEPYFMYNSLLLSGNGSNNANNNTIIDSSANNYTISRVGNPTQGSFSPYGANWSNYFDGTGDYLTIPSAVQLCPQNGQYTLEFWTYVTSAGSYGTFFFTDVTGGFILGYNNGSPLRLTVGVQNTSLDILATVNLSNTWSHIAVTRDASNFTRLFVNGTIVGSGTISTNYVQGQTTINRSDTTLGCYISNLRFIKGTALYTSAFTPSTTPLTAISGTSLLTCQSNRFVDNSTNNFTITKFGDTSIQRYSPFSPGAAYSASTTGGSAYFDGTGDRLDTPSVNNVSATGDFTLSFWTYPDYTDYPSYKEIIGNWSDGSSGQWLFEVTQNSGGLKIYINGLTTFINAGVIPPKAWTYISLVRSGSTVTAYFNGVSQGSVTYSGTFGSTSRVVYMGDYPTTPYPYNAYISDVRFVTGSAITTVPTTPLTAVSGTQLLLSFTNAGVIDSTMINNLETVGDAKISTTQSKFGGSSMSFDGTGDYLKGIASNTRDFGTSNFTIELWVYHNVLKNYSGLIGDSGGTITTINLYTYADGKFGVTVLGTNEQMQTATGVAVTATWQHIALVRSSGVVTLYVDGVSKATYTSSVNMQVGNGSGLSIGSSTGTGDFNGYIDDLRITRGYARYTANFTPPTTAFSQK